MPLDPKDETKPTNNIIDAKSLDKSESNPYEDDEFDDNYEDDFEKVSSAKESVR